jgi:hypothetical protein
VPERKLDGSNTMSHLVLTKTHKGKGKKGFTVKKESKVTELVSGRGQIQT